MNLSQPEREQLRALMARLETAERTLDEATAAFDTARSALEAAKAAQMATQGEYRAWADQHSWVPVAGGMIVQTTPTGRSHFVLVHPVDEPIPTPAPAPILDSKPRRKDSRS